MKSEHSEYFNHDDNAAGYDQDVADAADPIRTGYDAVLDWVAKMARITSQSRVLELGSGTGNLTQRLDDCEELVCVDVSERMEELARHKISRFQNRRFIKEDILQVFDHPIGLFDAILSTFTVHHLTEPEKLHFFREVFQHLKPGGRAVFGDLMVENAGRMNEKIEEYISNGNEHVAEALKEEFFWHLEESVGKLEKTGFDVEWKRFSDLSFGIAARKSGA